MMQKYEKPDYTATGIYLSPFAVYEQNNPGGCKENANNKTCHAKTEDSNCA